MGHSIIALVIAEPFSQAAAARFDLRPITLDSTRTLFFINLAYELFWAHELAVPGALSVPFDVPTYFPTGRVLRVIAEALLRHAAPRFGVLMTDYFGGVGSQYACLFVGDRCEGFAGPCPINQLLRALGVIARAGLDEFDTVGLGRHRTNPTYLERYAELCDARGL